MMQVGHDINILQLILLYLKYIPNMHPPYTYND